MKKLILFLFLLSPLLWAKELSYGEDLGYKDEKGNHLCLRFKGCDRNDKECLLKASLNEEEALEEGATRGEDV